MVVLVLLATVDWDRVKPAREVTRPAALTGVSGDSVISVAVGAVVLSTLNHVLAKYAFCAAVATAGGFSLNHEPLARVVKAELPVGAVAAAILLRVADLFENREAVQDRSLYDNPTFARLLAPYRSLSV